MYPDIDNEISSQSRLDWVTLSDWSRHTWGLSDVILTLDRRLDTGFEWVEEVGYIQGNHTQRSELYPIGSFS